MSSHHIVTPKTYGTVLIALACLMALTCFAAKSPSMDISPAVNLGLALLIAVTKTACVMSFFMHVKFSSKLVKVFTITAPMFLMILFFLVFSDFMTRGGSFWSPFSTAIGF